VVNCIFPRAGVPDGAGGSTLRLGSLAQGKLAMRLGRMVAERIVKPVLSPFS